MGSAATRLHVYPEDREGGTPAPGAASSSSTAPGPRGLLGGRRVGIGFFPVGNPPDVPSRWEFPRKRRRHAYRFTYLYSDIDLETGEILRQITSQDSLFREIVGEG